MFSSIPKLIVIALSCAVIIAADDNDADALYREGKEALRLSESDPRAIVTAASKFLDAAVLYEKQNNTHKAVEANSFLYWCRKKMTSRDISVFLAARDSKAGQKMEQIEKAVPQEQAGSFFEQAEKFAADNPVEHMAIAVRYFEVADRFAGTETSLKAQKKSLAALQQAFKGAPAASNTGKQATSEDIKSAYTDTLKTGNAKAAYKKSVSNAQEKLLKTLQNALDSETKRGNLDEVLALKNEIQRLSDTRPTTSTAVLKNTNAAYGQRTFAAEILSARKNFISALASAVKEETGKKNLDLALQIKDDIRAFVGAPKDAIEFQNHFYKTFEGELTWAAARRICEENGGHLLCIESSEEEEFIEKSFFTGKFVGNAFYWIGMYQNEQRLWVWINGSPASYLKFHPREPNGSGKTIMICRDLGNPNLQWGNKVGWDDLHENTTLWAIGEWGY